LRPAATETGFGLRRRTGGETNYVMAMLALFLSIYNLFINLLSLLMAFGGERD
jgi:FtsH-binding integral membrane protein